MYFYLFIFLRQCILIIVFPFSSFFQILPTSLLTQGLCFSLSPFNPPPSLFTTKGQLLVQIQIWITELNCHCSYVHLLVFSFLVWFLPWGLIFSPLIHSSTAPLTHTYTHIPGFCYVVDFSSRVTHSRLPLVASSKAFALSLPLASDRWPTLSSFRPYNEDTDSLLCFLTNVIFLPP